MFCIFSRCQNAPKPDGGLYLRSATVQQLQPARLSDSMSSFAQAPAEILGSIVRLLPLREKMLCESVCQNWLQLLRGSHTNLPQLASTVWGNEVRIIVCGPQRVRDKIRISDVEAHENRPARTEITLCAADTSQTATERQFVRWFARVAPYIGKVAVFLQAGETPPIGPVPGG